MKVEFDNGDGFTAQAVRRALAGEPVASFVDPELLKEAEAILAKEQSEAPPLKQAA